MSRRLVSGVLIGALAAAVTASATAQVVDPKGYVQGVAGDNPQNSGYVLSATGTPDNNVVKSGVYNGAKGLAGGRCYRTGYWTPAMAIAQCDADLVKTAPAPAPAPTPAPAPAPAPAPTPAPAPAP